MNGSRTEWTPSLIARLKGGDHSLFSKLYDDYASALYTAVVQILEDEQTVSEVLENVFSTIKQDIVLYDESKQRLFTWLFSIAREQALSRNRLIRQGGPRAGKTSLSANRSSRTKSEVGFAQALNPLSPDSRMLLETWYYSGLTISEMARSTGMTPGMVQKKIRLALSELTQKLVER